MPQFVAMLQLSRVHLYLTYPFVLSWSLLEAMSAGCAIVASDTAPLREAIRHDETGVLVDFFDPAALAEATCQLLDDPARRARLGAAARVFARENYDLKQVCLPRQMAWVEALAARPAGEARPRRPAGRRHRHRRPRPRRPRHARPWRPRSNATEPAQEPRCKLANSPG